MNISQIKLDGITLQMIAIGPGQHKPRTYRKIANTKEKDGPW
jgi:hypothetical protein